MIGLIRLVAGERITPRPAVVEEKVKGFYHRGHRGSQGNIDDP